MYVMAVYDRYVDELFRAARRRYEEPWPAMWRDYSDHRAAVEARDDRGETLLMAAAEGGSLVVLRDVLDAGADVEGRGPTGYCALHSAAYFATDEHGVALLLGRGADVGVRDEEGNTALTLLFGSGVSDEGVILAKCDLLLAAGADPNAAIKKGHTALMLACDRGSTEAAVRLLDAGADASVKRQGSDGRPESALHSLERARRKGRIADPDDAHYREALRRITAAQ